MSDALKPQLHGRDHRPGGRDPIPQSSSLIVPWARLGGGAATVPNNTWTNLAFREAMSYNEVAAGFAAGDIFNLEDLGSRFRITLEMDGLYLVHGLFGWDDTFAEYRAIDLQQSLGDHLYSEGYGLTTFSGPFSTTGGPFANINWISSFIFKSSSVNAPDPQLDPRAYQSSGVNRGCSGFSLRVLYLGDIGAEASWIYLTT